MLFCFKRCNLLFFCIIRIFYEINIIHLCHFKICICHPFTFNSSIFSSCMVTSLDLIQSLVFLTFITLPMLCFQSCFLPALNIVVFDVKIKYYFSTLSLKLWCKLLHSSFFPLPPTFFSFLFHSFSVGTPKKT